MKFSLFALSLSVLLSACVVGRDYQTPDIVTPKTWSETVNTSKNKTVEQWWQVFEDKQLNLLIDEAFQTNLNFKQTLLRIQEARILRSETIATGLPSLNAKNLASQRFNNSAVGAGGAGVGNNRAINIFQLGFDAQWELDFFGGIQRAVEVADASIEAEIENSRNVFLTLLGDITREYVNLRLNQQLLIKNQALLATQQSILKLVETQQKSGLSDYLIVEQTQNQCNSIIANLPVYETEIKKSIHALSILLARNPEALTKRLELASVLPIVKNVQLDVLPSELLQRRPDIKNAERQLTIANANVGIATSELYPKVNLAAFVGLQNTKMTDMINPISKSWSNASTITMPLFNWGKLNANVKAKNVEYEQTLLSYQDTILNAFKEVEDALLAYRNEEKRLTQFNQMLNQNESTLALTTARYNGGLINFIQVLEAQKNIQQTQLQQLQIVGNLTQHYIALNKALGNGYIVENQKTN